MRGANDKCKREMYKTCAHDKRTKRCTSQGATERHVQLTCSNRMLQKEWGQMHDATSTRAYNVQTMQMIHARGQMMRADEGRSWDAQLRAAKKRFKSDV